MDTYLINNVFWFLLGAMTTAGLIWYIEYYKKKHNPDIPELPPFEDVWNHVKEELLVKGNKTNFKREINLRVSVACKYIYDYIDHKVTLAAIIEDTDSIP